jgi:CDP-diacylglycerol--glycerol-3-phosphate 3-phosphatidyltransferase
MSVELRKRPPRTPNLHIAAMSSRGSAGSPHATTPRVARVYTAVFGRRVRNADDETREDRWTFATKITAFRACTAAALFALAIATSSQELLLGALGLSMVLDFLDGFIARSKNSETVFGAQLDGLADRMAAVLLLAGVCLMRDDPITWAAAAAVWLQFGVLDQLLTSQFLRFGLWSPDHFYAVDEQIWRLNWSALGKFGSNLPIALLALGGILTWFACALALVLILIRLPSYAALSELARRDLEESYHAVGDDVVRQPRKT